MGKRLPIHTSNCGYFSLDTYQQEEVARVNSKPNCNYKLIPIFGRILKA
jgi:hypothetical protein